MALEGSWTRGRPSKGLRQVNVRYQVEDPQWREIEELLERVPYKKVNEVMRYALLLGSKILLSTNEQGQAISSVPNTLIPKALQTAQQPAGDSSAEVKSQGPQYSQTAKNMFDTFGSQN
jgi:hypothetical protein